MNSGHFTACPPTPVATTQPPCTSAGLSSWGSLRVEGRRDADVSGHTQAGSATGLRARERPAVRADVPKPMRGPKGGMNGPGEASSSSKHKHKVAGREARGQAAPPWRKGSGVRWLLRCVWKGGPHFNNCLQRGQGRRLLSRSLATKKPSFRARAREEPNSGGWGPPKHPTQRLPFAPRGQNFRNPRGVPAHPI